MYDVKETRLGRINRRAKAQTRSKVQTLARFKVVCQDMSELATEGLASSRPANPKQQDCCHSHRSEGESRN